MSGNSVLEPPAAVVAPEGWEQQLSPTLRRRRYLRAWGAAMGAALAALIVGGLLIRLAGGQPLPAYRDLVSGAVGSEYDIGQLLVLAVPLLIIGLGLSLAFRGRVWNIGAEGQFYVGALACGSLAILLPTPASGYPVGWLLMGLSLVAAAVGGAVWGGVVGVLRAQWGVNEIITSLLLNYVGIFLFDYVIRVPLRDPTASSLEGKAVPDFVQLPQLPGFDVHIGIFVAAALVPLMAYVMYRTPFGFRVRMLGLNPEAARTAGVSTKRVILQLMLVSGALAGLAGGMQVLGVAFRLDPTISQNYGYIAIIVALLGRLSAVGTLFGALFIAGLTVGGQAMSVSDSLPYALVSAIEGIFVIFLLVSDRFIRA
jgi:simple sugar transport system permease protein